MADLFTLNDLLFMSLQPNHAEGPPRIKNAPGIHTEVSNLDQRNATAINGEEAMCSQVPTHVIQH